MHTVTPEPAATRRRPPVLGEGLSRRRRLAGALTGLVVLPLLTLGLAQLRDVVNLPSQALLYLLAVVVVALVGGLVPALAAAVAAAVLLDRYFVPPLYDFDVANPTNVVALVAFVLVAGAVSSVVGLAARRTREAETLAAANAAGREELRGLAEEQAALRRVLAEEQAALRRVATLVARGVAAGEVFAAVAQEVGSVLGADATNITRLEPDGAVTVLAVVGAHPAEFPVGSRWTPEPPLALAVALRTGRPARLDDFSQASDAYGDYFRRRGFRSGVAVPIVVEGCLWGGIAVGTRRGRFLADTEARLAGFTELVGSAIANAEGRAQLEDSRDELRRLVEEQAALRRVATLVARGVPAAELFAAVAQEVGHVLGADATTIARLEPDGAATVLTRVGDPPDKFPLGSRWTIEPPLPLAVAVRTGRPARLDDFSQVAGAYGDRLRRRGFRSGVAAPIIVEGRVWGAIGTGTRREDLPAGAEERLAGFTELVGTAIANADSRAELTASRARIVDAADDARRRIERDLHDGTQQRLIVLGLELRLAQTTVPAELPGLQTQIGWLADELTGAIEELRELARGIHPVILSEAGLAAALRTLARRSAILVELDLRTEARFREPVEVAAYFVVSEVLTNVVKYADASYVTILVEERFETLWVSVQDDGVGGADPARGSGLVGIRDRVEALGGSFEINSPVGEGTLVQVCLPLQPG